MKFWQLFTCWWSDKKNNTSKNKESRCELLHLDPVEPPSEPEDEAELKAYDNRSTPRHREPPEDDRPRGLLLVELHKKEGSGLGLVISGGVDKNEPPTVSSLRPGGIAHRSDALQVGDVIVSVNGIKCADSQLKHDEIVNLIKNASGIVTLELEYILPEPPPETYSVLSKRVDIRLEKDGNSFGFTLRGGAQNQFSLSRPFTVTQIRPGSSADREGTLKLRDRVLAINGVNVGNSTLTEVMKILRNVESSVMLSVEYDVAVMEAVQKASGPLLVEIDKTPGVSLGLILATASYRGRNVICIDGIRPASIADRCGALHVGDEILSIDETSLEHMTVAEATQLLKCSSRQQIKLEILPIGQQTKTKAIIETHPPHVDYLTPPGSNSSNNSAPQYTSTGPNHQNYPVMNLGSAISETVRQSTALHNDRDMGLRETSIRPTDLGAGTLKRDPKHSTSDDPWEMSGAAADDLWDLSASLSSGSSSHGPTYITNQQVCHTETTEVILHADNRGFGFMLQDSPFSTEGLAEAPIIGFIEPRGPAEKSGVLQEGDRVLAINGEFLENITLAASNKILAEAGAKVTLHVEFDVADSVVPSSGVFMVKLAKKGGGLGISIRGEWHTKPRKRRPGDVFVIYEVKKGSVAHRTGTLQAGDKLLAVNNLRMHQCNIEEAMEALELSGDIVRLRIQREDTLLAEDNDLVSYTVEFEVHGGPLGMTISGTEEPFDPITISALTKGGLAERTCALHVGDRILAINGNSLHGVPLSEAIELLQLSSDTVTLKIARKVNSQASSSSDVSDRGKKQEGPDGDKYDGTPIPSVDSALESWDSTGLENNHQTAAPPPQMVPHVPGKPPLPPKARSLNNSKGGKVNGNLDLRLPNHTNLHNMNRLGVDSSDTSPSLTPAGSLDQDMWSKNLDNLDLLSTSEHLSDAASISSLSPVERRAGDGSVVPPNFNYTDDLHPDLDNLDELDRHTERDYREDSPSGHFSTSTKLAAEATLREVEEQMQNIFTPTAVELHRVTLLKVLENDSFGFSLSDGVYEKGVYISEIQPAGPADKSGGLRQFDRILQINERRIQEMDCSDVVPLIATSGRQLELVISRNPLASAQNPQLTNHQRRRRSFEDAVSDVWKPRPEHKSCPKLLSKDV